MFRPGWSVLLVDFGAVSLVALTLPLTAQDGFEISTRASAGNTFASLGPVQRCRGPEVHNRNGRRRTLAFQNS
ncbi:hypothetical protein A1Q1_01749 [Trichosporon asahii var. asahii CBS 2479]|uniref:Secreted protein n=1 Tax=Trichosporon asahii var. asahii (strain ATCC 90039 / CBS 2479 / JCM 2466 / KCTC 7840 / NBRC 103889/ NCYC 2677 / UAMH 7654) TaxID=1186058 RepID=J4UDB7_TRIAS|nr:hypothetical protein A1Q1_01749 [Trichosporon asahii var. asahii CBS 2479]EJT49100.1 hypothetical protein A1Q1_01749 [Trichosporon asahii var. asahii CBS 2479]